MSSAMEVSSIISNAFIDQETSLSAPVKCEEIKSLDKQDIPSNAVDIIEDPELGSQEYTVEPANRLIFEGCGKSDADLLVYNKLTSTEKTEKEQNDILETQLAQMRSYEFKTEPENQLILEGCEESLDEVDVVRLEEMLNSVNKLQEMLNQIETLVENNASMTNDIQDEFEKIKEVDEEDLEENEEEPKNEAESMSIKEIYTDPDFIEEVAAILSEYYSADELANLTNEELVEIISESNIVEYYSLKKKLSFDIKESKKNDANLATLRNELNKNLEDLSILEINNLLSKPGELVDNKPIEEEEEVNVEQLRNDFSSYISLNTDNVEDKELIQKYFDQCEKVIKLQTQLEELETQYKETLESVNIEQV